MINFTYIEFWWNVSKQAKSGKSYKILRSLNEFLSHKNESEFYFYYNKFAKKLSDTRIKIIF